MISIISNYPVARSIIVRYYNLSSDIAEQINLVEQYPDKLDELVRQYDIYAKENGVIVPDKAVGYATPPKADAY